ncbi:TonB-dependent receptor [Sphingomonas sp. NFR15]|uniref:TonB-dependent receptor n=1 Tax=Sphingomonas sp. NFR15 TaxID=1566282 RepID=UPI000888D955|nr:TonB-dependent receptor [Sphingomonas sp. NFR15]SDA17037.1 Outer membrane receptor proteins, mostly Fe transport [Sphingomonas sp. NFR15]
MKTGLISMIALATGIASTPFAAHAADAAPAPAAAPADDAAPAGDDDQQIVVTGRRTRSVVEMDGIQIQKQLPGINPLKAIQTLPGVTFLTADPWGNNEQNISLFIHGFNQQQLGYTLDGIPLGDQTYGNYNGLAPQRAVISENVGRVTLASGAGDLGTASTSNLGGTIDTFSSDPKHEMGGTIAQTFGSYNTYRTFVRIDSGDLGTGSAFYLSGVRQDARAWDFNGHQGGYQANGKFVHDDATGKFTIYAAYSDKTEPNEDATVITPANRATAPYTRPFFYPDFAGMQTYLNSGAYKAAGSNYRNYYSDAQRTDYLAYAKYDWRISDRVTWTNQAYAHHNDGVGVVAGPIDVAGLPGLFSFYYPGVPGSSPTSAANLARLSTIFGGSGLATRTTEYQIDRGGILSTLSAHLGNHEIEVGGWYERQSSSAFRRWYALDVNNPSSPYTRPFDQAAPLITQYGSRITVDEIQTHIQDTWHILPNVTVLAGFKSTFQKARQDVPVQPIPGSFSNSTALPVGRINTDKAFLPEIGATWAVTEHDQFFVNAQQNIRQFPTSAATGLSPFALGSQPVFEDFKANVKPETSWTYEVGARAQHAVSLGPITGFEGQISYYHVDFSNRLLALSPTTVITSIISGAAIIQNVGDVKTNGVDFAATLHFGPHFSIYNAVSYNDSQYQQNYSTGVPAVVVPTAGKQVPGSPKWLNKTVVSANYGIFDLQFTGDYLGRRFATYTNDLSVPGYFTLAGRIGVAVPLNDAMFVKTLNLSVNVTNITDQKGASTLSIGAASGTFNQFPVAPRQVFGTISVNF